MAAAYLQRVQLWAAGFHRTEGLHWDSTTMQGSPFKYFSYGAAATEVEVDGFTGAYRVRRVDIVHDVGDSLSPLVDIGQVEGAFVQGAGWLTLEDLRWDESDSPTRGRLATGSASTYKLPSFSEMPDDFRVALLERAHEDGAVYGSKAVGEPPLMLAFSVREALRQAAAAFGPAGRRGRPGLPGHAGGGLLGDRAGARRGGPPGCSPSSRAPRGGPRPARRRRAPARTGIRGARPHTGTGGLTCTGSTAVERLRATREPGVLVTLASVRGHSPRDAGAKMVVVRPRDLGQHRWRQPRDRRRSTRARRMLEQGATAPEQLDIALSDKARTEHGRQCCGGEVGILLEPLAVTPSVAVFGMGHVGHELARILSRHDLDLHLVDSREEQVDAARMPWLADAVARVQVHHAPLPEMVLDAAAARDARARHDPRPRGGLRPVRRRPACSHLGTIGLIGSSAKWSRFERRLTAEGHPADVVARIRTPIGVPDLDGKEPATIAVAVAADLLRAISRDRQGRPPP